MSEVKSIFQFSHHERLIFALLFMVVLIVNFPILIPEGYSIDDYSFFYGRETVSMSLLKMGRFSAATIHYLLDRLGIYPAASSTIMGILCLISVSFMGIIIMRLWNLNSTNILSTVVVLSLFLIHPYYNALFSFRMVYSNILGFIIGFCGLYFCAIGKIVIGILSLVVGFGFYQAIFNHLAIIILGVVAIEAFFNHKNKYSISKMIIGVIAAIIVYFLASKIALVIFNEYSVRFTLVSLGEFPQHLKKVVLHYLRLFVRWDPLVSVPLKALLLLLGLLSFQEILKHFLIPTARKLIGIIALVITLLSIVGIFFIITPWYPTPRTMSAIGIFWSLIAVFSINSSKKWVRICAILICIIVNFSFAAKTNQIFADRSRVNLKDHLLINRIIGRLESRDDFNKIERIAILGFKRRPLEIPTQDFDLNVSAFAAGLPVISNMIYETTGYLFRQTTASDCKKLKAHCSKGIYWPHPRSIDIQDGLAMVCISEYEWCW